MPRKKQLEPWEISLNEAYEKMDEALRLTMEKLAQGQIAEPSPPPPFPFADEDRSPLASVVRRIGELGRYPSSLSGAGSGPINPVLPMLTLEEFFEGNDFDGSIMPNVEPAVTVSIVYQFLKDIRNKADVHDVRIMVTQLDDFESWPFSDSVWVVTSASLRAVRGWFKGSYRPDEVAADVSDQLNCEKLDVPAGYRAVLLWYD